MIAFIKGIIYEVEEENVVVETNNIGYNVKISASTAANLPKVGQTVILYTYTCVREDAFLLYGFLSKDELGMFKKLITVNGIGPKGGLAVLSVISAEQLVFAIMAGDSKTLSKAPGIGAKTAQRIILDLKDKVKLEDGLSAFEPLANQSPEVENARSEVLEALIALGYSSTDALRAIGKVAHNEEMTTQTLLKATLKQMG